VSWLGRQGVLMWAYRRQSLLGSCFQEQSGSLHHKLVELRNILNCRSSAPWPAGIDGTSMIGLSHKAHIQTCRLAEEGTAIKCYSVHPGIITTTNISRHAPRALGASLVRLCFDLLMSPFIKTPEQVGLWSMHSEMGASSNGTRCDVADFNWPDCSRPCPAVLRS
jgi:hypothetical protein